MEYGKVERSNTEGIVMVPIVVNLCHHRHPPPTEGDPALLLDAQGSNAVSKIANALFAPCWWRPRDWNAPITDSPRAVVRALLRFRFTPHKMTIKMDIQ